MPSQAERLRITLTKLGPAFVKIGQVSNVLRAAPQMSLSAVINCSQLNLHTDDLLMHIVPAFDANKWNKP